jgi:hypothetical protein
MAPSPFTLGESRLLHHGRRRAHRIRDIRLGPGPGPGRQLAHAPPARLGSVWVERIAARPRETVPARALRLARYGALRPVPARDLGGDVCPRSRGRRRQPETLVGHSYGGAVALIAALAQPRRIRALALYEPTLFALLEPESPSPNEADGIRNAVAAAGAALDAGDPDRAAECFIDFWMGKGAWARTPEARRGPIASSVVNDAICRFLERGR